MSPLDRRRRERTRQTTVQPHDRLSFKDRQQVQKLEIKHGVIVSSLDEGLVAKHWRTDEVLAEADDVKELEIVLRSMHIYPDDETTP